MIEKLEKAIKELSKYYEVFQSVDINNIKEKKLNLVLLELSNSIYDTQINIDTHFKTFGTMIDLSRNAVFTVEYMKDVIRKQALMGVNKIMLYTEDVYFVEGEPYFGYMRGRYTKDEIKEIVSYADIFDIEIIPCIQTLGHMGQFLRWGHNSKLKDQQTVLMTEIDEVYVFIEKLIKAIKEMYQTDTVHIGMDETFGLGFGRYYKLFGYKHQYDIFINHLNKVNDICLKHGFKHVMIWSDMFFRISSKVEEYYDPRVIFNDKIVQDIPINVDLVYWDYYNYKKEIVDGMIKKHQEIKDKVVMASGTWIWTKLNYDKNQTDKTARVHIDSCIENGVDEIYFTQWNDDGAPCNYETSFLGLFEMAGYALTKEKKLNKKVFELIMNTRYDDALLMAKLNESPINPLPLLWDDPLLGIFINNELVQNPDIIDQSVNFFNHYLKLFEKLESFDVNHTKLITQLLKSKVEIRKKLQTNYKTKHSLKDIIPMCEKAILEIEALLKSFRTMWLSRYKAFGLDVIQSRLATLSIRYKETIDRITDFENNVIQKIDELEEQVGPHQYIRMNHMNIAYSSIHVQSY